MTNMHSIPAHQKASPKLLILVSGQAEGAEQSDPWPDIKVPGWTTQIAGFAIDGSDDMAGIASAAASLLAAINVSHSDLVIVGIDDFGSLIALAAAAMRFNTLSGLAIRFSSLELLSAPVMQAQHAGRLEHFAGPALLLLPAALQVPPTAIRSFRGLLGNVRIAHVTDGGGNADEIERLLVRVELFASSRRNLALLSWR